MTRRRTCETRNSRSSFAVHSLPIAARTSARPAGPAGPSQTSSSNRTMLSPSSSCRAASTSGTSSAGSRVPGHQFVALAADRGREPGMIVGVPAPELITDPHDPRVADFRDLKAGDRPAGTPRGTGPVIVEGVPAVERLLASPYRVRAVFGVPGRVAALDLPADVPAYEADKWVLSEVIGFRLTRGVLASAERRPPADLGALLRGPDPAAPRRLAALEGPNHAENLGSLPRPGAAPGIAGPAAGPPGAR